MRVLKTRFIVKGSLLGLLTAALISAIGCSQNGGSMSPYAENEVSGLGQRDNKAILDDSGGAESDHARHALEVMGSYRRAQAPQPYYPVVQPAEVRLMWVPDHINRAGDLVPAHYYYLKVQGDRWAVQDAFELSEQLDAGSASSATPFIYKK